MLKGQEKYHKNGTAAAGITEYLKYSAAEKLQIIFQLVKIRITVLVSFTTALGYILAASEISAGVIYSAAGIFLLACSSAALNQYQESSTDLLMDRTKSRPIPSGKMSPRSAILISLVLLVTGTSMLAFFTNTGALIAGLFTFYWYNGVYTPLKKKTSLAVIPGSLVGALPPVAGWLAAGGNLFDREILYVALYFFVWQIPHFWLLLLLYSDDFKKGGFPVLSDIYSRRFLKYATSSMLLVTAMIGAFIPAAGLSRFVMTDILIGGASAVMIYSAIMFGIKKETGRKEITATFITINLYTLAVIMILTADKMFYLV